jgi:hypothetical protein
MTYSDLWQRRHALQLCGQLPDDYADGIAVLKHMREIWDHLHLGDDGVACVPNNVLTLVPKPPPDVQAPRILRSANRSATGLTTLGAPRRDRPLRTRCGSIDNATQLPHCCSAR